jgi:predicted ATPase
MEYWAGTGRCALGAASVINRQWDAGHDRLRDGLERMRVAQIHAFRPTFLGFLAEAEIGLGRREKATEFLGTALDLVRTTQERWFEPELQRLRRALAA